MLPPEARSALRDRLQARRPEIEEAVLARVNAVSAVGDEGDREYAAGLRAALAAALDYGVLIVERGEKRPLPVPVALLSQARLAARNSIGLDTVLRRYFAGYSLLGDFLVEEAQDLGLFRDSELQTLLRDQAAVFDRLIAEISEEYAREEGRRPATADHHRTRLVLRLLEGEPLDASELAYGFDGHHLGVIGVGTGAREAIQDLTGSLDRRLLLLRWEENVHWAWLGGRRPFDPDELETHLSARWPEQVPLAVGEPGEGLPGWRLTHRQAAACLPIAQRGPARIVRYAEVALVASLIHDDLLTSSLQQLFIAPLAGERDGGEVARETLRAYFAADRNVTSAAAALGVSRHTVTNRLHAIEDRLGRSLSSFALEVEAALRIHDLGRL